MASATTVRAADRVWMDDEGMIVLLPDTDRHGADLAVGAEFPPAPVARHESPGGASQ